jgi:4-phytase/acid phosphatase
MHRKRINKSFCSAFFKKRLLACLLLGLCNAAPLHVERVVILMRHGVRPPTKTPALPVAIAPEAWPVWEVPDGFLTPHGAQAIQLLGAYDRQVFAPAPGCPDVAVYADVDERTVKTGEAFAAGFAPGCKIVVGHAAGTRDPLFSPLDGGDAGFDAQQAKVAMEQAADGVLESHAALLREMQDVLAPGQTGFLDLTPKVSVKMPGTVPKLSGPLAEGASGAEDFLLEYLDGMPMAQVAWGRADKEKLVALLALHPLAYTVTARPDLIAAATARPLAARILAGLQSGPKITVLVGHDTNIAELGGRLGLHWQLGGYPADDPPPGGGLVFALLSNEAGQQFVTVSYQVQTMDEIRYLQAAPPATEALAIPGCGDSVVVTACPASQFSRLVK